MYKLIVLVSTLALFFHGKSQTILLDEGFLNGIPSTWSVFNEDQLVPDSSVAFVNEAWVAYQNLQDTCAVSTSYYTPAGPTSISEDYLVTPKLDLLSFGHILSWESKSFDGNYPESYYVLLSTTDSLPASFTDTLKFVSNDSPNWKVTTINIFDGGYANQPVFVAFKNASTDAFLLGIDNVKLTTDDVASVGSQNGSTPLLYPNPVKDLLFISALNSAVPFQLFNIRGQKVSKGMIENGQLNVSGLIPGIYFLEMSMNGQAVTKKIVKQ